MRAFLSHPWTRLACRLALGGLFIVAALGKLKDPVKFMGAVSEYRLLPRLLLPFVAAGMPGVELLSGLALVLGWQVRANALVLTGLLGVFLIALSSAMARGMDLDCSCFDMLGIEGAKVGWGTLARDGVILLFCVPLLMPRQDRDQVMELSQPLT